MKLTQMPPLPAYEDMMRLIRIAAEPELAREQLEAIEAARQSLNKRIADEERLSKVEALEAAVKVDREQARVDRIAAEQQARETYAQLEADRATALQALKDEVAAGRAVLKEQSDKAKAKAAELSRRENKIQSLEADMAARLEGLAQREAAVVALQAEYEEKAARLRAAMG